MTWTSRQLIRGLSLLGIPAIGGGANSTPEQAAADWVAGLSGKTDKITRGVQAVTVAPGQAAARQKALYLAQVQANVDKWASKTAAVPLETWKSAMTDKGIPRIGQGATAAQSKMSTFFARLLPHIDTVKASLPPRGNFDQNLARLDKFLRGMHNFSYKGS